MILHRLANDVGDLHEAPVVRLVQRPQNAPLHRLQTVREIRNGAVANDVAGVVKKAAVHALMQRLLNVPWYEWAMHDLRRHVLHFDMGMAVAVFWGGCGLRFLTRV